MRYTLISLLFIPYLWFSNPGESTAELTCKSASGRTTFKAVMPSISYLESAEFSVDGTKLNFTFGDKSCIIADLDKNVLTIYLEDKEQKKFLKFWAIPSSFKKTLDQKGPGSQFHKIYTFKAKAYATEPRKGKELVTPQTDFDCTLDFQL
ncbi:MAG: hypothetical protein ABI480_05845 [Chitinophagaceae bacterium]